MASNFNEERKSRVENSDTYSKKWDEGDFSQSVNKILQKAADFTEGTNLIQLLQILIEVHPEYSSNNGFKKPKTRESTPLKELIKFLYQKEKELNLSKLPSVVWAKEVLSVIQIPVEPPVIDGRLFLIAVILINFKEVQEQLENDFNWNEQCAELIYRVDQELVNMSQISYKSLLKEKGQNLDNLIKQQSTVDLKEVLEQSIIDTNNLSDGPAKEDSLSRRALAKYLAKRLRYIYYRDIDFGKYGSFFMHIDGAWGSGKSTLLGFLEEELEKSVSVDQESDSRKLSDGKWVIVNFNAWENQRLNPPWWFLMKSLYNESIISLEASAVNNPIKSEAKKDQKKLRKLFWNEWFWRLNTGNEFLWIAIITLVLFITSLFIGADTKSKFQSLPVIELVTLFGFIWSSAKVIGSSLASGSAKAARNFIEENSRDPLHVVAEHFKDQIKIIGYPVAIFIDDLDRCNMEYGIRLLEGLQTIFKKAGVVYVIAADRKWLSTMYEHQYEKFAPILEKPSKPFGMVFLDKIFQLIVELPDISAVQKKIYWDNLLNISLDFDDAKMNAERETVHDKIKRAGSNAGKMGIANDQTSSPQIQQMAREEVLGEISIQEEEKILEHKLQHFIDLIEPNPRAMKRLINDISTARAIAFLYNQEVDENQLILWTILKLQHPLLAEYFWNHPQKMDAAHNYINLEKPFSGNPDFDTLIANASVKSLFKHKIADNYFEISTDFLLKLKFQSTLPVA